MNLKLQSKSRTIFAFLMALFSVWGWGQTVWTYNFGTTTATVSGASSDASNSFPNTQTNGGTVKARIGNGTGSSAGSFTLANPGLPALGTEAELQFKTNGGTTSATKFGLYDYTASREGYMKFRIAFSGGSAGTYALALGDGTNFSDNNSVSSTQIFSGIQWQFGSSNAISYQVLNGGSWVTTGLPANSSTTLFSQSTSNVFEVEIYYNNTANSITYSKGGSYDLSVGKWDLWVNNVKINTSELSKGSLSSTGNIDSFIFYHQSSVAGGTQGTIYIDDIEYSNALPVVSCTAPATPNGVISGAQSACNTGTLTYTYGTGEPLSGVSYYWQTSATGTNSTAANSASNPLNITSSGSYFVRAYNGTCWSTATTAYGVTINSNPTIGSQPSNQTVTAPTAAIFNVTAPGTNTYQWQVNKNNGNGFVNVTDGTGGTTASYTTEATSASMNGYLYQVLVTNSCGNVTSSSATLTVVIPPANDLCSSATALTSGNTLTGSMVNATATSGLAASPTKKDVWYKYTALNSGNHVITANFASGVDLDIHIYTGACPASGNATFVGETVGGTSEVLNANLVSGTDYYIRVIDYDENATTFTINLQEPLPCVAPAIVTNLNLTPTSSSIAGTFTANTASGYMVVLSTNSTLSSSPVNGIIYNVGDSFGGGTVVKFSAGANFTANNLNQNTNYHFFVFSYNTQCIGEPFYNGTSLNGTVATLTGPCLSEDFTGWSNAYGNWTRTTSAGTWTAVDSFSGGGQIQMNDVGDYLELPLLNNPSSMSYDGALSSSPSSNNRIKVQYYNGTSWVDVIEHTATSTTFASFTATFPSQLASMTGVRVRLYRSADDRTHYIDNVQVFCATPIAGTTWTNSGWSNGTPSATVDAIISSNYSGSGFVAQNLTIDPTYTLTINNNETVTAGNVTNNGNIIVNDGGNFVQTTGGVYTSGTGASFITNRNSASVGGKYVFWSSPVANQNLYTAYSNGSSATAPTYVMTYDTATNLYPNVTNDNANFTNNAGKGYSVKVPANNATVAFGGGSQIPNNGTVNVALAGTSGGINNFNLIGNPYPSNIDLNAFYSANQSLLNSTFWFWDNTTGNVTTQTGNTSVNVGYATVNAADPAGNTWVEAPGTQTYNNTVLNATGNIAKVGQGFIVKALDAGNVSFTNAMRSSSVGGTLNKNASSGKFWIKLTTSYGNTVTQAITYSQGASDAYDVYDSKAMGMGSDAFYNLVGAEKLVIQGKSTFHIDDVVQLGNKHFENGNFTISLSHKEGLFANGQDIYLHDKQTGTYTNLQSGAYNFSANAGDFTNRFEIVYKLNVLSTNETEKGSFEVYRNGEDFVVRNNKNIQSVEVFDAAGRKVQQVTSNSKSLTVKVQAKGLYILKAISEGKEYTQKIIK